MLTNESNTTAELTDDQMDALAGDQTGPSEPTERPMSAKTEEPAADSLSSAPTKEELLEFVHNGKQVKATRDQVIKWAQMGYDAPQRIGQLNQERQAWEAQKQEWEKSYSPYKQVDEWAKSNPDAWQKIQQGLAAAQAPAGVDTSNPLYQELQSLKSQLGEVGKFIQGTQAERQAAQKSEEDQKLDAEVKSIRDQYPDLDFDRADDNGKSLEIQVLEHCHKNGIGSFKTGFRDFYHDQLVARAEAQAKTNLSKEVQKKTKMGVLGESPTPRKGLNAPQDVKNKSYEDLTREALEELGLGA